MFLILRAFERKNKRIAMRTLKRINREAWLLNIQAYIAFKI